MTNLNATREAFQASKAVLSAIERGANAVQTFTYKTVGTAQSALGTIGQDVVDLAQASKHLVRERVRKDVLVRHAIFRKLKALGIEVNSYSIIRQNAIDIIPYSQYLTRPALTGAGQPAKLRVDGKMPSSNPFYRALNIVGEWGSSPKRRAAILSIRNTRQSSGIWTRNPMSPGEKAADSWIKSSRQKFRVPGSSNANPRHSGDTSASASTVNPHIRSSIDDPWI